LKLREKKRKEANPDIRANTPGVMIRTHVRTVVSWAV